VLMQARVAGAGAQRSISDPVTAWRDKISRTRPISQGYRAEGQVVRAPSVRTSKRRNVGAVLKPANSLVGGVLCLHGCCSKDSREEPCPHFFALRFAGDTAIG